MIHLVISWIIASVQNNNLVGLLCSMALDFEPYTLSAKNMCNLKKKSVVVGSVIYSIIG
jgi:hypothetical protein